MNIDFYAFMLSKIVTQVQIFFKRDKGKILSI